MTFLALALTNAAFAQNYGVSNDSVSTCNYASFGAAVTAAKASPGSTIYATAGNHSVPGVVLDENVIIRRGSSNCTPGGSGVAVLDFNYNGHITVKNAVVIMYDMVLREGDHGNLEVKTNDYPTGSNTSFYGFNVDFIDGQSFVPSPTVGGNVKVSSADGAYTSLFYCSDCLFDGGHSGTAGGGLYVGARADALLFGDIAFTDNTATTYGGAIYVSSSANSVRFPGDMYLSGNTASGSASDVEVAGVPVIVD